MKRYSVAGDVQDQSIDLLVGMMLLRSDTTAMVAKELVELSGPKLKFEEVYATIWNFMVMNQGTAMSQYGI